MLSGEQNLISVKLSLVAPRNFKNLEKPFSTVCFYIEKH